MLAVISKMKKGTLTILFICFFILTKGQSIKARFLLSIQIDNSWLLKLNKDNTYKYIHWSGFSGETTLDSGYYKLTDTVLHLNSSVVNNKQGLPNSDYYIKQIKLKKYQHIWWPDHQDERFALFGRKYIVLTSQPFDHPHIQSSRTIDNVLMDSLPSNSTLEDWIKKIVLPNFGYSSNNKLPDSCWTELYNDQNVKVLVVSNGQDLFSIFYKVGQKIYSTRFERELEYHKAVINEITRSKKLTKKNGKKILKLINVKIKAVVPTKRYVQQ